MTTDQLAMVDVLADTALAAADSTEDAAMMLVVAAGNALINAFGIQGTGQLLQYALGFHHVIVANDELRREQRGER